MYFFLFFVFVHDRALLSYYCFCSYIRREWYSSTKSPLHFSLTWNSIKFVDSFFSLSISFSVLILYLHNFLYFFYFCFVQYTFRLCVSFYIKFCVCAPFFSSLVCLLIVSRWRLGAIRMEIHEKKHACFVFVFVLFFGLGFVLISLGKESKLIDCMNPSKLFSKSSVHFIFLSSFANKLTIECCKSNICFSKSEYYLNVVHFRSGKRKRIVLASGKNSIKENQLKCVQVHFRCSFFLFVNKTFI